MNLFLKRSCIIFMILLMFCSVMAQRNDEKYKWKPIFNGKNLKNWDIKITDSPINVNFKNIFRVENGILKVSYDQFDKFNGEYGHIYYKTPYSNYILRVEYRFVGEQLKGGEIWNIRNSGVMIHSQSAASMGLHQSFPVSLEVQFLGGLGKGPRSTANLCTPGTTVEVKGKTFTDHILESSAKTYDGDQWVTVDVIVLGDSIIHHYVNGEKVLSYWKPKIGGGFVNANNNWEKAHVANSDDWIKKDGTPLKSGYIALQAESHPVEFRKVELIDLEAIKGWKKLNLESLLHSEK